MAEPYRQNGRTTRVEDKLDLIDILRFFPGLNLFHASELATLIVDAGFTRPKVNKVTKLQMWSYFFETFFLGLCAWMVMPVPGLGFVFGALVALTIGGLITLLSGFIINHGIKIEAVA